MWIERSFNPYYLRTALTTGTQESQHCSRETQDRWPYMSICKLRLILHLLFIKGIQCTVLGLEYLYSMHIFFVLVHCLFILIIYNFIALEINRTKNLMHIFKTFSMFIHTYKYHSISHV